jgi:hypothetical protein
MPAMEVRSRVAEVSYNATYVSHRPNRGFVRVARYTAMWLPSGCTKGKFCDAFLPH